MFCFAYEFTKVLLCFIMRVHDSLMGLALDWVLRYFIFLCLFWLLNQWEYF
jgi:hypothetical protein